MAKYFGVSMSDIAFVPTAYMIAVSSTLLLISTVFSRYGYKKTLLWGYAGFILSTFICSFAPRLEILVFFRLVQGLCASILLMSAFALPAKYIEPNKLGLALGFASSALGAGVAGGYPIGGFLTEYASWRFVFIFVSMLSLPAFYYAYRALPSDTPQDRTVRFDITGAAIIFMAMSILTYILQYVEYYGINDFKIHICMIAFFIFIILFVLIERKKANPIVDISLFKSRDYGFAMASRVFVAMLQYGNLFIMPFYLHVCKKYPPVKSGLIIAVYLSRAFYQTGSVHIK
jgi:predicted MFS family arabinose efflux permease